MNEATWKQISLPEVISDLHDIMYKDICTKAEIAVIDSVWFSIEVQVSDKTHNSLYHPTVLKMLGLI